MKHILFFLLIVTTVHSQQSGVGPQAVTGKMVALVIGNNRYATSPLENCVSDAAAIAKLLREQLKFDIVLADSESENLNRLGFTRRLQAFQKEAQGAAVAVFYYAGHGMEDFDGRDNYLIPVDANLAEAGKDNAGLQSQGIPLEFVLKTMKDATQGAKIILLDCCRERPADRAIQTRDGGGFVMPVDGNMPQDTLIMLAAAPARTASDGVGHGPFTAALLKHLPTPGTALFQTFRTVRNEVLTSTNQQQKPWLKLDGAGDFFYDHSLVFEKVDAPMALAPSGIHANPSSVLPPVNFEEVILKFPTPMFIGTPVETRLPNLETPKPSSVVKSFMAPRGTRNLALGKKVTSSDQAPIIGGLQLVTDGDADGSDGSFVEIMPGLQWVQIDLETRVEIQKIAMWHYHKEAQVYLDVIIQVSDDPQFKTGVTTLWNSDHDNSSRMGKGDDPAYVETCNGRVIDGKAAKARYVRLWSSGNTNNDMNHYCEVQVFALPAL